MTIVLTNEIVTKIDEKIFIPKNIFSQKSCNLIKDGKANKQYNNVIFLK